MKHKYLIVLLFLLTVGQGMAQEINFYSPELDSGVRAHFNIDEFESITEEMTDTTTVLNLHGLGITDIRDLVYFPSLETLNLSNNGIRDISPLLELRNLRYLNIHSNFLEAIDMLALSESLQMTVILSSNYIKDFYAIMHSPQCLFSIIGMNLQYPNNYEVRNFYTDYDLSTSNGIITSDFWGLHARDTFLIENNGSQYQVFPDMIQQTNVNGATNFIYLTTEGQAMDSTLFIPPTTLKTKNESVLLVPSFEGEEYAVLSAETFHSDVEIRNDSVFLTKSKSVQTDTVKVAFGHLHSSGISQLRGYAYFVINNDDDEIGIAENKLDKMVTIYPNPASNFINITCKDGDIQFVEIYSQAGQKCFSEEHTEKLNISFLPTGVYIVLIHTNNGKVEKMLVKK